MTNQEALLRMSQDAKIDVNELLVEENEKRRLEKLSVEEVISGLIPDWMDRAYEEGSVYRMPCVFHTNVRTPRGTLALDFFNDRFNCHSCQAGGTGGFNFARNLVLRELKGDFAEIHISQQDYVSPEVLNQTFEKLSNIDPVYLSEQQRNERKRAMETNLAKENIRKKKGRMAAWYIWNEAFSFPSGKVLKDNWKFKSSAAYKWGTTGQKKNAVNYLSDYPNIKITARLWKGYENPEARGCIIAPLISIPEWDDIFTRQDGIVAHNDVGSIHLIAVDKDGEKAVNLNVDNLAKKDNKYKIGRKMLDSDSSVFMLQGKVNNRLIICEGLGDALALHKLFDCYVMAPIGVIGKLSKHSEAIVNFCVNSNRLINEIWLMPDNDAGLNMLSRFDVELKNTLRKYVDIEFEIKSWILADKDKKYGLDPAEVLAKSISDYNAKRVFTDNLVCGSLSVKKEKLSDLIRSRY